jgi:hypothetical protein
MRNLQPSEAARLLRTRDDLMREGHTSRRIDAAVATGALRKVRRGWYVEGSTWADLWPEGKHLLHVLAVVRDSRSEAVTASHHSAGVLHGIPLYRTRTPRVHLTTDSPARISSGSDVLRHVHRLPDDDIVVLHGVRCTSLARTIFDLSRTLSTEAALAAADAAMRSVAVSGQRQDPAEAARWREEMQRRMRDASGARGIRQGRWISEIADGRAQLPGESVSRLQLLRLGFEGLDLQVPVRAPDGGWYWVDIGFERERSWGEFDGETKYLDESLRSGRSIEQVMLDEKQREDWIRGTTRRGFARWGESHILTPATLGDRLARFGIVPGR